MKSRKLETIVEEKRTSIIIQTNQPKVEIQKLKIASPIPKFKRKKRSRDSTKTKIGFMKPLSLNRKKSMMNTQFKDDKIRHRLQ